MSVSKLAELDTKWYHLNVWATSEREHIIFSDVDIFSPPN